LDDSSRFRKEVGRISMLNITRKIKPFDPSNTLKFAIPSERFSDKNKGTALMSVN